MATAFYYWTLDGDFILVDGEKIKAQVRTCPGQNAVSPNCVIL